MRCHMGRNGNSPAEMASAARGCWPAAAGPGPLPLALALRRWPPVAQRLQAALEQRSRASHGGSMPFHGGLPEPPGEGRFRWWGEKKKSSALGFSTKIQGFHCGALGEFCCYACCPAAASAVLHERLFWGRGAWDDTACRRPSGYALDFFMLLSKFSQIRKIRGGLGGTWGWRPRSALNGEESSCCCRVCGAAHQRAFPSSPIRGSLRWSFACLGIGAVSCSRRAASLDPFCCRCCCLFVCRFSVFIHSAFS